MGRKSKEPHVPHERHGTIRQEIIAFLERGTASAKDISSEVRIPEKEAYEHLEHIQRSLSSRDYSFLITPARCIQCGFEFRKRERLKKPGRCPLCRSESIQQPLFSVKR